MSKAATEEKLQELHRLLAEALMAEFTEANPCPTCGRSGITPAMLRCVVRFLNDNGIESDAAALQDLRRSLAELTAQSLPFKPRK
jgi:hypothetical protein